MNKGSGRIIYNGVVPEKHELVTYEALTNAGKTVELLKPQRITGSKTPDIKMDGLLWEVKSPKVNSWQTFWNIIRKGLKQSPNIIIDLHRLKKDTNAIKSFEKMFRELNKATRLIIITKKSRKLLEFSKK